MTGWLRNEDNFSKCSVLSQIFVITSSCICVDSYLLVYIDNLNDKYQKKSEKSETTQIQLADFTKKN